ncbi:MAG: phosphatidate cytidylyltransferase, partial [Chitinophagales bacterium]
MQKMNNLTQRLITAVVGAAVLITGMLWNVYSLIIVLWSLSFAIHFEYLRRVQNLKDHATRVVEIVLNLIIGMLVFSIVPLLYLQTENLVFIPILLFFPLLSLFFIFELFMKRENPYRNIGLNIAGIFYCIVPFALLLSIPLFWGSYLVQLRDINPIFASSGLFILGYFLIVWTHDTMSYFTGKAIGKHKLFERISPKKTWEGFFGGFIFSIG